jgi:hypothetical protein
MYNTPHIIYKIYYIFKYIVKTIYLKRLNNIF